MDDFVLGHLWLSSLAPCSLGTVKQTRLEVHVCKCQDGRKQTCGGWFLFIGLSDAWACGCVCDGIET